MPEASANAPDRAVVIVSGQRRLTIVPEPDFSVERVICLLNCLSAVLITDNQIVSVPDPGYEFEVLVAKVLDDNGGQGTGAWITLSRWEVTAGQFYATD